MKNPLGALKSFNYKQFALDHGEKVVLGVGGCLVLFALAFGTQWSRYDGDPAELKQKAEKAGSAIQNAEWPDEEKQSFVASTQGRANPKTRVDELVADLELTDTRFTWDKQSPIDWKPIPPKRVFDEPEWKKLMQPIADAGRIVLDVPLAPEVAEGETDDEDEGDGIGGSSKDEDALAFKARSPFERRSGAGTVDSFSGEGGTPSYAPGSGLGSLTGFATEDDYSMYEDMVEGDETTGYGTGIPSGFATHYVAVRMVFPARDQLNAILASRGHIGAANTEELMSVYDFEIQRQQTIAGPQLWSEWEDYNLDSTMNLLALVSGIEQDVVDPRVVSEVMTMPLPIPKYGYWGIDAAHATHPLLKEYRLTPEKIRAIEIASNTVMNYNSAASSAPMLDFGDPEAGEMLEGSGMGTGTKPKAGWSTRMASFQAAVNGAMDTREKQRQVFEELKQELEKEFGPGAAMLNLQQLTQLGKYQLFRFVDFDIEPGRAYRYRARLKFHNPNFNRPLDRVRSPEVAEGALRPTEWSDPTPPVVIQPDLEFYVDAVNEATSRQPETAKMNVHVWSEALGTWIADSVTVAPGEPVGGKKAVTTTVVDLIKDSYDEDTPIRFETKEILADVLSAPTLTDDDEFHSKYLSIPRKGLSVETPVVVLDETGALVALDPLERGDEKSAATKRVEAQHEGFKILEQTPETGMGDDSLNSEADYEALYGSGGGAYPGEMSSDSNYGEAGYVAPTRRRPKRKRQNALRIGGKVERNLPKPGANTNSPFPGLNE